MTELSTVEQATQTRRALLGETLRNAIRPQRKPRGRHRSAPHADNQPATNPTAADAHTRYRQLELRLEESLRREQELRQRLDTALHANRLNLDAVREQAAGDSHPCCVHRNGRRSPSPDRTTAAGAFPPHEAS